MLTEHLLCTRYSAGCKRRRNLKINSVCPKVSPSGQGTNVTARNNRLCRNFPREAIVTEQMPNKSLSCDTVTSTDEVTVCGEESRLCRTSCNSHLIPFYRQSFLLPVHLARIYRYLLCARLRVLKTNPTKTQPSGSSYSAHYKFWSLLPRFQGSEI